MTDDEGLGTHLYGHRKDMIRTHLMFLFVLPIPINSNLSRRRLQDTEDDTPPSFEPLDDLLPNGLARSA